MDRKNSVIVVGNGESRHPIDLQELTGKICLIGCNAVHRDAIVDHLVCCDHRMILETLDDINTIETLIYVRKEWFHHFKKMMKRPNIRQVPEIPYPQHKRPDDPKHWGSGTYALLLAANIEYHTIYIVGFDLYGKGKLVNNLYKGTKNYSAENSHAIDPSYWIYQSAKVFEYFPNKRFVVVNRPSWLFPDAWRLSNVSFLSIEDFRQTIDLELNKSYNN